MNQEQMQFRNAVVLAMLPILQRQYEGLAIADVAAEADIKPSEYDYKIHWPIVAARRAHDFAVRFTAELARLEDAQSGDTFDDGERS